MNVKTDIINKPTLRSFVGQDNFCITKEKWSHDISPQFISAFQQHIIESVPNHIGINFDSWLAF